LINVRDNPEVSALEGVAPYNGVYPCRAEMAAENPSEDSAVCVTAKRQTLSPREPANREQTK